jgi:peptidoglycan hydrolase-like protein with peptidoglycan-binding domain
LAIALALALGGCSTWQNMDRSEKGTAVGATGGAIVGAAVGGPVGAAVGAGVGGYAGHYETQPGGLASSNGTGTRYGRTAGSGTRYSQNTEEIRSIQQALNDHGYNVGAVDGHMGPNTQDALRRFQEAQNLPQTGEPDARTLAALGVSGQAAYRAPTHESNPSYRATESTRSSSRASSRYETQPRTASAQPRTTSSQPRTASSSASANRNNQGSETIRSVQQALDDQGYNAGTVDGVMGPRTEQALRQFQQAQNMRPTGRPDERTLTALGVSNEASNRPSEEAANPQNEASPQSTAAHRASDQTTNASNRPSAAANRGLNASSRSDESNEPNPPLSQGSNQESNSSDQSSAADGSTLPGTPTIPDSKVSSQSNDASPTTVNSDAQSKQPQ